MIDRKNFTEKNPMFWNNLKLPEQADPYAKPINTKSEYWTAKSGKLTVASMSTTHIVNSICQIEKRVYADWFCNKGFPESSMEDFRYLAGQYLINTNRPYAALMTEIYLRSVQTGEPIDIRHVVWNSRPSVESPTATSK